MFVSMKSNPTHFHVFANFLLMSFTLLQMGGKVFVSMSWWSTTCGVSPLSPGSQSSSSWIGRPDNKWMNEWMNVHESAAFDSWLQMTRALASVTGIPQSSSCPQPDLQCFMFASWWSCTRGLSQIWLQVRGGNSRKS